MISTSEEIKQGQSPGRKPNLRLAPASLLPFATSEPHNHTGFLTGLLLSDDNGHNNSRKRLSFHGMNHNKGANKTHKFNKFNQAYIADEIDNRNVTLNTPSASDPIESELSNTEISNNTGDAAKDPGHFANNGPLTALMFSDSYKRKKRFGNLSKSFSSIPQEDVLDENQLVQASYLSQADRRVPRLGAPQNIREQQGAEQFVMAGSSGIGDEKKNLERKGHVAFQELEKQRIIMRNRQDENKHIIVEDRGSVMRPLTRFRSPNSGGKPDLLNDPVRSQTQQNTPQVNPEYQGHPYTIANLQAAQPNIPFNSQDTSPASYSGPAVPLGMNTISPLGTGFYNFGPVNPMVALSNPYQGGTVGHSKLGEPDAFSPSAFRNSFQPYLNGHPGLSSGTSLNYPQIDPFAGMNRYTGMSTTPNITPVLNGEQLVLNSEGKAKSLSESSDFSLRDQPNGEMVRRPVPSEFMGLASNDLANPATGLRYPFSSETPWLTHLNGMPIFVTETLHRDNLEFFKKFPSCPEPALRTFELQVPDSYIWDIRLTPLLTFMQLLGLHSGDFNEIASDARTLQSFIRMVCECKEYDHIKKSIEDLGIIKCLHIASSVYGPDQYSIAKKAEKFSTQDIPSHAHFSKGLFTCPYRGCPLNVLPAFTSVQIRQHIMRAHPRKENCALCRKEFSRSDALKRHVTTVHKPEKRDLIYLKRKKWLKFLIDLELVCPNASFLSEFRQCFYVSLLTLSERRKKAKVMEHELQEEEAENIKEENLNEEKAEGEEGSSVTNSSDRRSRLKRTRSARPSMEIFKKKRKPYTRKAKVDSSNAFHESGEDHQNCESSSVLSPSPPANERDIKVSPSPNSAIVAFRREEELANQAFAIRRTTGADAKTINGYLCPVNSLYQKLNRSKILNNERRKLSKQ